MPGQTERKSAFEFGAWCFFAAWSLEFRACRLGSQLLKNVMRPWGLYPMHFEVKTLSILNALKWHYEDVINPVQERIGELACWELGPRKRVVRSVSRKEVMPNRRYSWRLYADENGTELVDVVVLDVNLDVALDIDAAVREQMEWTPNSRSFGMATIHQQAPFSFRSAHGGLIAQAKT